MFTVHGLSIQHLAPDTKEAGNTIQIVNAYTNLLHSLQNDSRMVDPEECVLRLLVILMDLDILQQQRVVQFIGCPDHPGRLECSWRNRLGVNVCVCGGGGIISKLLLYMER